jgi:peptidyl-prolyl cis-trans isomerase D
VMGVVMSVLVVSFGIWGINDIFRGFGQSSLAKVGKVEISTDQFRQAYRDRLQEIGRQIGRPVPADQALALGLDKQVLGEMIGQAGLDQRARQMRLGISDADIARSITSDPHMVTPDGKFDKAKFDLALRNMGLTEQRFIIDRRQTALRKQILDSVSGNIAPPQAWLDAINQFRNEERSIQYLALGPAQAGEIPQPTADEINKYFDERKIMFRAPETRKIATVTVTPAELAKWMEVSDDDIKRAYDERRSSFTTPERRHIEQIVFPNMADAQAAEDRIKSGTSIGAIAAERGLKPQDFDLGTIAKSRIVEPTVADAAFSLKEGEVSAPIQVPYGAVIVTALKIEPAVTKPLADVTSELRNTIALGRAKAQVQDIHDKVEDDRAGGASLEEAAAKLKLPVVTVEVDRSGRDAGGKPVANLPQAGKIIGDAFASDVGVENDPIDADGGYIWFDVTAITPAHERKLDEVKDAVEQRWRDDQIAARLKDKAAELLDKAKGGTPLDVLASANGVKLQTATDLKRGGASADITPRMTEPIFHTARDTFGSAAGDVPTQWIVFRVTDVKTPSLDPKSPDADKTAQAVQREITGDVTDQYMTWLETELGTTVNTGLLSQAMSNGAPDIN